MAATGGSPAICPLVMCRTSGGNRTKNLILCREIKDNIVNKPLKIYIKIIFGIIFISI